MKTTKKILVTASLGAFALATAFGVQAPKTVSAQTSDLDNAKAWLKQSFTMEKGAGARIDATGDGLRFAADWSLGEAEVAALEAAGAEYGMIIAPKDSIPVGGAIDEDSVFGAESPYYFAGKEAVTGKSLIYNMEAVTGNIDADAALEMSGALINVKTQNIIREYVGRAYVAIPTETDGEYEYYFAKYFDDDIANNTRSMYYVAQVLIEGNYEQASALQQKYIDAYAETAANYTFSYTVNHRYNDKVDTEVLWGTLNETVNVADVLQENSSMGYDVAEQTAKNAATSATLYAGGRLTLDVYYSQKIDTTEVVFEDVALAKASTFTGVTATNLPDGVKDVTYTYDNSATVPMAAGKYEAKANFIVDGEYEYLTPEAKTASVRLVSDNATIGAHGANGFEINYTLASTTGSATDFTAGLNYIFMGMPSYEDAVAANEFTKVGTAVKLTNPVNFGTSFGTFTWNTKLISAYGGSNNYYTSWEEFTAKRTNNTRLTYSKTEGDVTTYYSDLKLRVQPTETGTELTLIVINGTDAYPVWGATSSNKKIGSGYAGLNYNACVEGRSYLSNFSVTEGITDIGLIYPTANYDTIETIATTDFDMYYRLEGGDIYGVHAGIVYGVGTKNASGNAFSLRGHGAVTNDINGGECLRFEKDNFSASTSASVPSWKVMGQTDYVVTENATTASSQRCLTSIPRMVQWAKWSPYMIDFNGNGTKEAKFKWSFRNVTEGDVTTATMTMYLMNANGTYDMFAQATGLDPMVLDAEGKQQVALWIGYNTYGYQLKSYIRDFRVIEVNA